MTGNTTAPSFILLPSIHFEILKFFLISFVLIFFSKSLTRFSYRYIRFVTGVVVSARRRKCRGMKVHTAHRQSKGNIGSSTLTPRLPPEDLPLLCPCMHTGTFRMCSVTFSQARSWQNHAASPNTLAIATDLFTSMRHSQCLVQNSRGFLTRSFRKTLEKS